jgi:hypothetical protein
VAKPLSLGVLFTLPWTLVELGRLYGRLGRFGSRVNRRFPHRTDSAIVGRDLLGLMSIAAPRFSATIGRIPAIILIVLIAGCTSQPLAPIDGAFSDAPIVEPYEASINAIDGACWCFEMSIADNGQFQFATAAYSPTFMRGQNGTWETMPNPAVPTTAPPQTRQNDAFVQTDERGHLHYHALLTDYRPETGTITLYGLQYARSQDNGDSWAVNVFVSFPAAEALPQLGADRQWLTLGADALYLSYQRVPPILGTPNVNAFPAGVRMSQSLDGGATWSPFQSVTDPLADTRAINGQPIIDGAEVYVPLININERTLDVAISSGGPFERYVAYSNPDGAGGWFPSLVKLPDGFALAWRGPEAQLFVALSPDGRNWSPPTTWSTPNATVGSSPWALAVNGHLAIMWYNATAEDAAELYLSIAPMDNLGKPTTQSIAAVQGRPGKPAFTDFAHMIATDQTIRLIWSEQETVYTTTATISTSLTG